MAVNSRAFGNARHATAQSDWGGFASFSGVLMKSSIPGQLVSALIPQPLSRMPGLLPERLDLVLLFGEMSAGGGHLAGLDIPTTMRYREVAIFVPFVQHPGCVGPAVFSHRMFADDLRPIFLGNSCYGLRKEPASIHWSGDRFEVHRDHRIHFSATGALAGAWSDSLPHDNEDFRTLREIFELPILGRRNTGAFVRLDFEWSFARAQACAFVGQVELSLAESREDLRLHCEPAFAVRGMSFRTNAPQVLSHP